MTKVNILPFCKVKLAEKQHGAGFFVVVLLVFLVFISFWGP